MSPFSRIAPCTKEENQRLALKVRAMFAFLDEKSPTQSRPRTKLAVRLSRLSQEDRESKVVREGLRARDRLIAGNWIFIRDKVLKYARQSTEEEVEDMMGEAFIGWAHGVDIFDPHNGSRTCLTSYAEYSTREHILNEYHNKTLIRLPRHVIKLRRKINRYKNEHGDIPHDKLALIFAAQELEKKGSYTAEDLENKTATFLKQIELATTCYKCMEMDTIEG